MLTDPHMKHNLGIRRRLAPLLNNWPKKNRAALFIVVLLPGTPIVYYGDEIGMGDNILPWRPLRSSHAYAMDMILMQDSQQPIRRNFFAC